MNSRQRKKHRGLKCCHLFTESQLLATDPIPYYQDDEYCKTKDYDTMENNGVTEYQFNHCYKCRHFCPSREEIRMVHSMIKHDKNMPKEPIGDLCQDGMLDFDFDFEL